MKLSLMAWRTLSRNRRRTLITSLSIAFGVFLAVTFTGSGDYSYTSMINTSAVMGYGHVSVIPEGYVDRPSLSRWLADMDRYQSAAQRLPHVSGVYSRIMGQAMFGAGAKNAGGMFMAIDPSREKPFHNFFLRSIVEGGLFDDTNGRGALIGQEMARKMKLRLGRKIIMTVTDRNGELTSELFRVSGIFSTGDRAADSSVVLVPLGRMQNTLQYGEGGVSFLAQYVDDLRLVDRVQKEMTSLVEDREKVEVLTWQTTQADLSGIIAVDRLFNYLMQLLVGLVIAAGIMNTMHMSVLERSREFGIMMAVGMSPGRVVKMVLVESFWLGCLGIILGVVLTTPWYLYMSEVGIDLGRHVGEDYSAGGVTVDPVMKLRLYRESGAIILAVVFLLTLAASIYPAIRAGRIPPVEALKEA